jgi:hypothetical protein
LAFNENVTVPAFDNGRVTPPLDAPEIVSDALDAITVVPEPVIAPVLDQVPDPVNVRLPAPVSVPPVIVSESTVDIVAESVRVSEPAESASGLWISAAAAVSAPATVSVNPVTLGTHT